MTTMTPERWQAIDQILQGALVCNRDHRDEFVAHSCGDDVALQADVRSLLAAHDSSPSAFLERPSLEHRRTISARLALYAAAFALVFGVCAGWYLARSSTADRWLGALSAHPSDGTAQISPHRHWIAYTSSESGRDEVYVDSYPQPGYRIMISHAGGAAPVWRDDGRELFYWRGDALIAVPIDGSELGRLPILGAERVLSTRPSGVH